MCDLKKTYGAMKWAEATYKRELAKGYEAAAVAAEKIEEKEIANRWKNKAIELETSATDDMQAARSSGYYGPPTVARAASIIGQPSQP